MKGYIRRNPVTGTWHARLDAPSIGGRRVQVQISAPTRRELEKKVALRIADFERGIGLYPRDRTTMSELLDRFLAWKVQQGRALRTIEGYREQIARYLRPAFGSLLVSRISVEHIEAAIERWRSTPTFDGKKTARKARTINAAIDVLSTAMNYAVRRLRLRPENPVLGVDRPRRDGPILCALDADAIASLLSALAGSEIVPAVLLAFLNGPRRGELVGLRRGDVHLDRAEIHLRRGVVARGNIVEINRLKTDASRRVLYLAPFTAAVIADWLDSQVERLAALGITADASTALFDNGLGGVRHPDAFYKAYRRACVERGFEAPILHAARHSIATIAHESGIASTTVRDILGHENAETTRGVYTHSTAAALRVGSETIARSVENAMRSRKERDSLGTRADSRGPGD